VAKNEIDTDTVDSSKLIAALIEAVRGNADLIKSVEANTPVKKVIYGSKQWKPVTAFNPTGRKDLKFTRDYFQNGARINIKTADVNEIGGLEKLRAGKYIGGVVSVRVTEGDGPDDPDKVNIYYRNKTIEQRIANAQLWVGLIGLLAQCNTEADTAEELALMEAEEFAAVRASRAAKAK